MYGAYSEELKQRCVTSTAKHIIEQLYTIAEMVCDSLRAVAALLGSDADGHVELCACGENACMEALHAVAAALEAGL
eukprot:6451765-Amphidinium_carterae.1